MPDDINPQEFGRLQAEVQALRRDQDKQTTMLETLINEMSEMRTQLSEAKGGWKVLMALGGGAAALGSIAGPIVGRIFKIVGV